LNTIPWQLVYADGVQSRPSNITYQRFDAPGFPAGDRTLAADAHPALRTRIGPGRNLRDAGGPVEYHDTSTTRRVLAGCQPEVITLLL
jgi:hypothetical protein